MEFLQFLETKAMECTHCARLETDGYGIGLRKPGFLIRKRTVNQGDLRSFERVSCSYTTYIREI